MKTLQKDTIVYSRSGQRARFIAEVDGEFFVRPEIEFTDWEGNTETDWGDTATWHEIFPKAPTEVLDKEIIEKEKSLEELKNKARLIHSKITEGETLMREQKAKFARYEALKYLEDFIDKKITHYVKIIEDYHNNIDQLIIIDAAKAYDEDDMRYHRPSVKALVTLEGKTNGDLNWQLHEYYYKSQKHTIIPCKSHEEAVTEATKLFFKACEDFKKSENKNFSRSLINCARNIKLEIPDYIESYLAEEENKERLNKLERARKEFVDAQKKLADLEAGIPVNSAPFLAKVVS
jgi:hypothetical protein